MHLVGLDGTRRQQQQKEEALQLLVEATTKGEAPNRILVVQLGVKANEAKVPKAHAAPCGLCDNLINALKLLAKSAERW